MLFLSRSALESYQTCPRLYYLTYQSHGHGIVPARQSLDLADGLARHVGVSVLNLGGSLSDALAAADASWLADTKYGIEDIPDYFTHVVSREHRAIVEAGIRIWHAVMYPVIRQSYDILAVEKEHSFWVKPDVLFEGRPDAEFLSKYNQTIVAYSLKNPRQYQRSRHPECLIDMQGLSELWLLGNKYGHDKMGGVMMDYIMTGKEAAGEEDGMFDVTDAPKAEPKIRWFPGVRGWFKDMPDGSRQFAWRYKYKNPAYDPSQPWSKTNCKEKTFSGGKRFNAWDYSGGVERWVDDLISRRLIPMGVSPLDDLCFSPPLYFRQPDQISSFLFTLVRTSDEIQEHLSAIAKFPGMWSEELDYHFPQHTTSCINKFGKKCRAWEICHGSAGRNPLDAGYKLREPHHEKEAEWFDK